MDFATLVGDIAGITRSAQAAATRSVDRLVVLRSWLVGAWIVEYEQHGADRAAYGEAVLERLADELDRVGFRGLSVRNLKNFRQLALS